MIRFTLQSLAARRRRAAMTAAAVVLGVSMIAGTLIFTDTINGAFRSLFTNASSGADVIVASRQDISSPLTAPVSFHRGLVKGLRRLPGVVAAQGQIQDTATIVGRNGKAIESIGSRAIALSYLPAPFSGLDLVAGTWPHGGSEVAIDVGTANRQRYRLGDTIRIVTGEPARRFTIRGLVRLGRASLGATTVAVFSLTTARALYDKRGLVDRVFVAGAKGVSPEKLVAEIRPLLPSELVARTSGAQVDNDARGLGSRLKILTDGLIAFALIAVFVGAFVIFNTFSITVAQRQREFALLRAMGATRPQVLGSVLIEAVLTGLLASGAGLAGGLAAAAGIRGLFELGGLDLPSSGLSIEPRTAVVAVSVGVLATLCASLLPAIRATRVAPLEALRDSAATAPATVAARSRATAVVAIALVIAGAALIASSGGPTAERVQTSGGGAVLLLLAIVLLTPRAVAATMRFLTSPLERRGDVLAQLARENATRNPGRTAVTASSLMIGLALVLFVTVYVDALRASTDRIIGQTLVADFTIESSDGVSPIPAASVRALAAVPGLAGASSLKNGLARIGTGGGTVTATAIDPSTIADVYRFDWVQGSAATVAGLGLSDVLIEHDTAERDHLRVGQPTTIRTETGLTRTVTVRGIYRDSALMTGFVLPLAEFGQMFHQPRLSAVFVKLAPDVNAKVAQDALTAALAQLPGVVARSQQQLRDDVGGRVNSVLLLFYALLAVSVLTALIGLVNTLTLSIHERTRELGLLRAIGMTPSQARRMIRIEAVITAAMGAAIGIVLGVFFAWVATRALSGEGLTFSMPWLQVAVLVVTGLLAGALAAVPPAARAAGIDVLAAIAHE